MRRPSIQTMDETQRIRDQLLVLRAQSDPNEFEGLVNRWHVVLWRHAYRMTRDVDAAWDVVQEAWCSIYRGLSGLEDAAAFPKWAFCIVTNKCRDLARRAKRRETAMSRYEAHLKALDGQPKANERIEAALARLEPDLRVLVGLYYEDLFSIREIGEITGDPEGSIKSRLYRARRELRRMMEETDDG